MPDLTTDQYLRLRALELAATDRSILYEQVRARASAYADFLMPTSAKESILSLTVDSDDAWHQWVDALADAARKFRGVA